MIDGHTRLIAHIGFPTHSFKAPRIYNPYFEAVGINAVVVPMGVPRTDFAEAFPVIARFSNFHGALITMPHKVAIVPMLDRVSTAVTVAGACNAVRRAADGALVGDMFDGEGFARGVLRKGRRIAGAAALIVGAGGVGSAIAAALAAHGLAHLRLHDTDRVAATGLAARLVAHYPALSVEVGTPDPTGMALAVNATPSGMSDGDPLPMAVDRLAAETLVGEVVMRAEITPFLRAALDRGCAVQVGTDMLFEQIPAYLEFFGFPTTNADHLRQLARFTP
jgi:shikimate dehydrogenase